MSDTVEHIDDEPAVVDYLARLGAAMLAADYSVDYVRKVLTGASDRYHLEPRFLILSNYIQVGESCNSRIEHVGDALRYDQAFQLGGLVRRTYRNSVSPADGTAELARIMAQPRPLPWWVNMTGYGVQSAAYGLILQPTPAGLVAATGFGLLVGALDIVARFNAAFLRLLPFFCAFIVTFAAFTIGRWLHMGQDSLRVLIPPLTLFLPGVGITLVILAYTSGFGGGLALMLCTLALGELRTTPSSRVLLAPGFWLMVPSSIGLVGITEIVGGDGNSTNAIMLMLVSMLSISLGFQAGRAVWALLPARIRLRDNGGY